MQAQPHRPPYINIGDGRQGTAPNLVMEDCDYYSSESRRRLVPIRKYGDY